VAKGNGPKTLGDLDAQDLAEYLAEDGMLHIVATKIGRYLQIYELRMLCTEHRTMHSDLFLTREQAEDDVAKDHPDSNLVQLEDKTEPIEPGTWSIFPRLLLLARKGEF
jgi:hypothetical protein